MPRPSPRRNVRPTARVPRWEGLEARLVPAGVLFTDPAPGTVLLHSPDQIRVVFDVPVAEISLGLGDVILDRVADDGSLIPIVDDATALSFALPASLEPGRYRIILSGLSGLSAEDGTWLSPEDGLDQTLAEFTIARPGVTLDDASDLGTLGPGVVSVAGTLDLASDPTAVKLYKVTIPEGHFWRLGAEVSAQRDGGALDASLSLFDSAGHLLATAENGHLDAPLDPVLFTGLGAGTYYLGVSGAGNLPGSAGGYDPVTGLAGSGNPQDGGPFTLRLVADEADRPGTLEDFRLLHADPLDATPSGFSLRFSEALAFDDSNHELTHANEFRVEVIDAEGRSWPLATASYDPTAARVNYTFAGRLPAGHYEIRLPNDGGLADLAGRAPVSPGFPRGVLAAFDVLAEAGREDPTDLGTSFPSPDFALAMQPVLRPSESASYRVAIAFPAYYQARADSAERIGIEIRDDSGAVVAALRSADVAANLLTHLDPGVYHITLTNEGVADALVTGDFRISSFRWESLLFNGVGQGSALNLRLVSADQPAWLAPANPATTATSGSSPTVSTSAPSSSPSTDTTATSSSALAATGPVAGPFVPPSPVFGATGATVAGTMAASFATVASAPGTGGSGPSALSLDVAPSLVGRPSADDQRVAVVGPAGVEGSVAVAIAGRGPVQVLAASPSLRTASVGSARASSGRSLGEPGNGHEAAPTRPDEPGADPRPRANGLDLPGEVLTVAATGPEAIPTDPEAEARLGLPPLLAIDEEGIAKDEEADGLANVSAWAIGVIAISALIGRRVLRRHNARRRPSRAMSSIPRPLSTRGARPRVRV